jgi:hypothetical protein
MGYSKLDVVNGEQPTVGKNNNRLENLAKRPWTTQSILDVFVLQGLIEYSDAEKIGRNFKTNNQIENFLIKNKIVTPDTVNKAYSILLKLPFVGLKNVEIPAECKLVVTKEIARKYEIIPFDIDRNTLRIAIAKPSALMLGYSSGLLSVFNSKNIKVEVFITGKSDFLESIKQYEKENSLLLKKGSYPTIFLRNYRMSRFFLEKLPLQFVKKYRIVVFGENISGDYMIACEEPNSPLTKKVLQAISRENKINIEVFAASKDDFDYITNHWYDIGNYNLEEVEEEVGGQSGKIESSGVFDLGEFLGLNKIPAKPKITIDSISQIEETNNSELPIIDLSSIKIDKYFLKILPKELSQKYRVVVFGSEKNGALKLATDAPNLPNMQKTVDYIKSQHAIKLYQCLTKDFDNFIKQI